MIASKEFGEEYQLLKSLSYSFPQRPIFSSISSPNFLLKDKEIHADYTDTDT
jgi:hypothetical protein